MMANIKPIHQITDITNRFIYLVIVKKILLPFAKECIREN